ncbi:hypothetical protein ATO8_17710 [Roseivivax marinus]|uniref:YjiS-like domain-containing protein n=1 Tax=Roseivivax marinus TaxID=1379903 RepID=W4HG02_9RHOB|nr:DUF1127 domain-containing protein [Roseivivax marinus]ETW11328.1 hypothetical protein ATO8_17710 [Roseivivax marinus]UMA64139.1 DUF1127 domain-containing protein [Roseivivax marinus]SEK30912.1 protein of unknown function [Roseivivax marinus]
MNTFNPSYPTSLNFAGQIGGLFVSAMSSAGKWRDVRRTERQLNELTDRELADIGLTRSDIARVARGRR